MNEFKVGDRVRARGRLKPDLVLYEGVIIHIMPFGDEQFCTVEVAEGSGEWSKVKTDAIMSGALEKITDNE